MKNILATLFILLVLPQLVVAQNLKRANNLFEKREYFNAAELFLNENNKTQDVYQKLGDCYFFNSKMDNAVKYYQIAITQYEDNIEPTYLYRYSQALKGIENYAEADIWLKKYYQKKGVNFDADFDTKKYFNNLNINEEHPYVVKTVGINSTYSDFGGAFLGNTFVFASSRGSGDVYAWNNEPYLNLYKADIDESRDLLNAKLFSQSITTKMHESNAVFTKDGKTMYFTRNNSVDGKKQRDEDKVTHIKIYSAQLIDGAWTNVVELPFNNINYSTEHPALSPDEKKLYFASDMPGTIGSFDLFVVDILGNGQYGTPKNLGPKINTEYREQFPFISSNEVLYFASDGHIGLGGLDIFTSNLQTTNTYSAPMNMGKPLNSNLDDFALIIDDESEIGYFSSNRKNGVGDDDIYKFTKKGIYLIHGIVLDKNSYKPIPGSTVLLRSSTNDTISNKVVGDDAKYAFQIEGNKSYKLKGTKEDYVPYEVEFSTDSLGNIDQNILILLESYADSNAEIIVKHGKRQIRHDPIYFDLNSSYLRREAQLELNTVVNVMNKYPEISIVCGSHTDSRATIDYNMWLSDRRAKRTVDYIISRGISPDRITGKGFGESFIINKCTEGVKCYEYEHQQNRRTEFVIVDPNEGQEEIEILEEEQYEEEKEKYKEDGEN